MIFRKSSDTVTPRPAAQTNGTKTPMANGRTEPSMTRTNLSVTPPVSPITTAQRRATGNPATPANSYNNRSDQMRKLTVGRDISLNGEITTCDHLIVEGTVKATIKGGKVLDITEAGSFTGFVDIETADIAGTFEGDLIVRGKLVVRATANVTGTLQYGALQVDTGAVINGEMRVLPQQQAAQPEMTFEQQAYAQAPQNAGNQAAFGLAAINDAPGFLKASA
jgi:cytoskeletal protein CcmA (bactofilin family)